jgi:hypothetical protein
LKKFKARKKGLLENKYKIADRHLESEEEYKGR